MTKSDVMDINTEAVDEAVLALLYLNLCNQSRAWKSFDWAAMNRLHEKVSSSIRSIAPSQWY